MAFNSAGYTPVRTKTLPNGEYEVIIRNVEDVSGKFGNYRKVTVQARGKKGWTPNIIIFNERPVLGCPKNNGNYITEDDLKRWDRTLTTFFDAFGIQPNDFSPQSWVGKTGWCKVAEQYDPNEPDKKSKKFKELFPFVKIQEEAPEQQPYNADEYQAAPADEMPPDSEIPF